MKKTIRSLLAATLLLLSCASLTAEPAPWWKWRSKIDGKLFCAQNSLGPGWDRAYGPFRDGRCEKLIVIR